LKLVNADVFLADGGLDNRQAEGISSQYQLANRLRMKKDQADAERCKKCYPTVANGNQVMAEGIFVLANDEQSLADAK
jgi:hypothetical protein